MGDLGSREQITTLTDSVLFEVWDDTRTLGNKNVTANASQMKSYIDGAASSNISGAKTFTGAVTVDNLTYTTNTYTANGALNANDTYHVLDASNAACVMTLTPTAGKLYAVTCTDASSTVTVTLGANATFDGANNIATFNAADDSLVFFAASATISPVLGNHSVVLSA